MTRIIQHAFLFAIILALSACASGSGGKTFSSDELRADLQRLYEGLQSGHVALYANQSKDDYDALFEVTASSLDEPMTLNEAYLVFQKFAAYGSVAHASVNPPTNAFNDFQRRGGRSFPIFLRIVDGVSYVGEDYSGAKEIVSGDRIISLDGTPMEDWLKLTGQHISADTDYIANSLLEFRFPRYLWVELGEQKNFDLVIAKQDGTQINVTVSAKSWVGQRLGNIGRSSGFQLDGNARVAKMLDDEVAYLQPGPFINIRNPSRSWDNRRFVRFIDGAFEEFLEANAKTLVIDLRENPGGDSTFSDHMVAWIADEPFRFASAFLIRSSAEAEAANAARLAGNPDAAAGISGLFAKNYAETPYGEQFSFDIPFSEPREGARFDGQVYVLINQRSYSQAVNVAATFQDYGFGIIAGEPTSDFATTYGSIETFTLPNTGLLVNFPKAHIIRPSGDKVPGGVVPDLNIKTPIASQANDVVLEALLSEIKNQ